MKLYIVGIVASGKTTLAKRLSDKFNVLYYELDCIVHDGIGKSRYKRTPEEQIAVINDIDRNDNWIIEGTYRKNCHILLELADVILFLDTPLWLRKYRIFKRYNKQQLHMEKSHYKSDLQMLNLMYQWTQDFEDNRQEFESMLYEYNAKLITAKSMNKAIEHIEKRMK